MNNKQTLITVLLLPVCSFALLTGCKNSQKSGNTSTVTTSPQVTITPAKPEATNAPQVKKSPEVKNIPSPTNTTNTSNTGKNLKGKQVEDDLKSPLEQQLGFKVNALKCPEKVNFVKGSVFDCQVTVDKDTFPIEVNLLNDQGKVNFQSKGMFVKSKVESQMQEVLKKDSGTEAKVTCGDKKVLLVKPGDIFKCEVTTKDGKKKIIEGRGREENGTFEWNIPQ
jgi:hypothetical protein